MHGDYFLGWGMSLRIRYVSRGGKFPRFHKSFTTSSSRLPVRSRNRCLSGYSSHCPAGGTAAKFHVGSGGGVRTAGVGGAAGAGRTGSAAVRRGAMAALGTQPADRAPAGGVARASAVDDQTPYHVGPEGRRRAGGLALD